jgi:hypothetical protein
MRREQPGVLFPLVHLLGIIAMAGPEEWLVERTLARATSLGVLFEGTAPLLLVAP